MEYVRVIGEGKKRGGANKRERGREGEREGGREGGREGREGRHTRGLACPARSNYDLRLVSSFSIFYREEEKREGGVDDEVAVFGEGLVFVLREGGREGGRDGSIEGGGEGGRDGGREGKSTFRKSTEPAEQPVRVSISLFQFQPTIAPFLLIPKKGTLIEERKLRKYWGIASEGGREGGREGRREGMRVS